MRGFIITTILFSILLVAIFLNVFFVKITIRSMKESINSLTDHPSEENELILNHFLKDWNKNTTWLSLSVSYDDIQELTDMIDALKAANTARNLNQFQIYVELLLNSIDEIGRLEELSIKNIL